MQSFAHKVKAELCRAPVQKLCCARAECYGILLYGNTFNPREIRIITENVEFAARLPRLFQRAFNTQFDVLPQEISGKMTFQIHDPQKLHRVINTLGYEASQMPVLHVNFGILEEECDRIAFLRGTFLAGGSVTDPEKRYHLELDTVHAQASREVSALLEEMGFFPRAVLRGGSSVTYFKQSEHIEDFLTTIGAPVAAMDIMTAKVDKEIKNRANRAMNCDMANVNKTIEAAESQMETIEMLRREGRLDTLPQQIKETALLRMANPELSLAQLAEKHEPPITKSCLNHRLRKIMEIGRTLK